jgi:glycosyltransferase involved in cell wall biosynthesis
MVAGSNIHIALPAMNEAEYITQTLDCLRKQTIGGFHTWVCVNQPEEYHQIPAKAKICENNQKTLKLLQIYPLENLHVIDKSSRGMGWETAKTGVGMARKTIMDTIAQAANPDDIIISMDADTVFNKNYLQSVSKQFSQYPNALALANPYYHPLIKDDPIDRAILRYEIYMRYYALNMRFSGTPFCFTPLGSTMSAKVSAYKKINGLTPKKSGEDFYFLQKMVKTGKVLMYNDEIVFPGTRLSDRVFFGTGPAMIKGIAQGWEAYPLFNPEFFTQVKDTIALFPKLFLNHIETPMDEFLEIQFGKKDIFGPLRQNHKNIDRFVKACHEKIDGLRILQFLKVKQATVSWSDENNLKTFIDKNFPENQLYNELKTLNFSTSTVDSLNKIRNFLFHTELKIQKDYAKKRQ